MRCLASLVGVSGARRISSQAINITRNLKSAYQVSLDSSQGGRTACIFLTLLNGKNPRLCARAIVFFSASDVHRIQRFTYTVRTFFRSKRRKKLFPPLRGLDASSVPTALCLFKSITSVNWYVPSALSMCSAVDVGVRAVVIKNHKYKKGLFLSHVLAMLLGVFLFARARAKKIASSPPSPPLPLISPSPNPQAVHFDLLLTVSCVYETHPVCCYECTHCRRHSRRHQQTATETRKAALENRKSKPSTGNSIKNTKGQP